MSGRRLLDAARLLNASRSIAKQHLQLRSQQLDVYSKTSTLAKAVKGQTDRVTLTAQAAIALASKLNEQPPTYPYSTAYPPSRPENRQDASTPREGSVPGSPGHENIRKEALTQDHHYIAEEKNAAEETPAVGELSVRQEKPAQKPLADGTLPPPDYDFDYVKSKTGGLSKYEYSADVARHHQRRAEAQIPSITSTGPSTHQSLGKTAGDHDQDVYYDRPKELNMDYSSLPRAKIPKHVGERQKGSTEVNEQGINADTYYSAGGSYRPEEVVKHKTGIDDDDVPKGVNINVLRASKMSNVLQTNQPTPEKSPRPQASTSSSTGAVEHPSEMLNSQSKSSKWKAMEDESNDDIHRLANDIAKDAQSLESNAETEPEPFQMRESRVPSSRLGRLWQYSGLATSMAFGALGEGFRRVTGAGTGGSLMLSPGNMERLVAKLSRMRGAALKLGQMISFQDLKMLPAPIHDVLQRVQDSADYMPASQRNQVLASNLGSEWRNLFSEFSDVPIAAASIGQVHRAILASTGQEVAVKVQYPGVAGSIDSDLNNLSILLTASRLLPKGLYLDKTIANARTELGWECDYIREAECATRFRKLVKDETDIFTVPAIIPEASGKEVLTAQLMHGTAVTKLKSLAQEQRDWIGSQILRLCLREICEFRFMQTDPNWTNFLFNPQSNKIELLDFGASREYPLEFVEPYIGILKAASINDRATIQDLSIQLGYLTGSESKTMLNAHIDSVLTLSEPFKEDGPEVYDFRDQTITDRVRSLIPLMVKERLAPPPEETYSLHRKLSGAFLLCAKLGSQVHCKELFRRAMEKFESSR